jgi:hypothetical protein
MGGGGTKTSTQTTNNNYDPVATAASIDIANRQQAMGEEQWAMYAFLPYEVEYAKSLQALLPASTQASISEEQSKTRDLELSRPIQEKFYAEVARGPDYGGAMGRAVTDVNTGFDQAAQIQQRSLTRAGLSPEEAARASQPGVTDRALALASAKTGAYNAEKEAFLGRAVGALGVRDKVYAAPNQFNMDSYRVNSPATTGAALMGNAGNIQAQLASRVTSSSSKSKVPTGGGSGALLGTAGTLIGAGAGALLAGPGGGLSGAQLGATLGGAAGVGFGRAFG